MHRSIRIPALTDDWLTRRQMLRTAAAALGGALLPVTGQAQQDANPIRVTNLGTLRLLRGAGCNVIALPGDEGALLVDGGLAAHAEALLDAVFRATGNERIHTLINTHWHPEQTGANERVGRAGGRIFAHEKTHLYLANDVYSATFAGRRAALPEVARPHEVTRSDGTLQFAGQRIDYGYLPAAHTDGDLYVHFVDQNVLVAGGVVSAERWPLIDYRSGAWYGGRVRALEWLAELVQQDTTVVPAHGNLINGREVIRQRDIYQALFETLIEYMNLGLGPEDVVARNPLAQYTEAFGDAAAFLDGAYRSMLIAYVPD